MRMRLFSTSKPVLQQNHYHILGVTVNSSAKEIKKQFYLLSKRYHPDANKEADPVKYQQITQAYTILSNNEKRREFDQTLGEAARQPQGYTGQKRSWQGTKRAQSGYKFHDKWAEKASHSTRSDPTLDPLRAKHRDHSRNDVPHFDHIKHYAYQRRQDELRRQKYHEEMRRKQQESSPYGSSSHSSPSGASSGLGYIATGLAGVLTFSYLLLR